MIPEIERFVTDVEVKDKNQWKKATLSYRDTVRDRNIVTIGNRYGGFRVLVEDKKIQKYYYWRNVRRPEYPRRRWVKETIINPQPNKFVKVWVGKEDVELPELMKDHDRMSAEVWLL